MAWKLVFLILTSTMKAPTQANIPTVEVTLRPNNANGLTIVVQCNLGRPCSGCLINWYINGSAISGPDYVQQFREEDGVGSLAFPANSSYDGANVSCVFRILSEDNTFHNRSSESAAIPFAVVAPTPIENVTSENIPTTDKVNEVSVIESGSGQMFSNETGSTNNTNKDLQQTPGWIIGTSGGIAAFVLIISLGVMVGLLLCCTWKKLKPKCRGYDVNNGGGGGNPDEQPGLEDEVRDSTTTQESKAREPPDLENKVVETTTQESEARERIQLRPTTSTSRDIPVKEDIKKDINVEGDSSTDLPAVDPDESASSFSKLLPMHENRAVVTSLSVCDSGCDVKTFSSSVTSL